MRSSFVLDLQCPIQLLYKFCGNPFTSVDSKPPQIMPHPHATPQNCSDFAFLPDFADFKLTLNCSNHASTQHCRHDAGISFSCKRVL